ncbi:MAG: hypothetical protein D6714_11155 [Bacteroidetes bacterium]|nr:MAG: hypothetical protein D6714_11155 [Bacteroidota bacterium]
MSQIFDLGKINAGGNVFFAHVCAARNPNQHFLNIKTAPRLFRHRTCQSQIIVPEHHLLNKNKYDTWNQDRQLKASLSADCSFVCPGAGHFAFRKKEKLNTFAHIYSHFRITQFPT